MATLFEVIRQLKREEVSVIFVSHKLDELYAVCDRVTVMRDGQTVRTGAARRDGQARSRLHHAGPRAGRGGARRRDRFRRGHRHRQGGSACSVERSGRRAPRPRRELRRARAARSWVLQAFSAPGGRRRRVSSSAPIAPMQETVSVAGAAGPITGPADAITCRHGLLPGRSQARRHRAGDVGRARTSPSL